MWGWKMRKVICLREFFGYLLFINKNTQEMFLLLFFFEQLKKKKNKSNPTHNPTSLSRRSFLFLMHPKKHHLFL